MYGAVTSVGATAYVITKIKRMRQQMTPATVARATALSAADVMEFAGKRLAPSRDRSEG